MLNKVGIVTAATAAGLLALSPLAFAGDYDGGHDHHGGHGHHGGHHRDHDRDHDRGDRHVNVQRGLVNLGNIGVQVPIQACNNSLLSGVLGILSSGQRNRDRHDGSC
ncbi:MAG TPA: hypothetical protein VGH89_09755, partial [Pseudonocardia sp.]